MKMNKIFLIFCTVIFTNTVNAQFLNEKWQILSGKWENSDSYVKGFADEGDAILLYQNQEFENFTCSVKVKPVTREGSLILRARDAKNCYLLIFVPEGANEGYSGIALGKRAKGRETYFAGTRTKFKIDQWVNIKADFVGNQMKVFLNDELLLTGQDNTYKSGKVGLRIYGRRSKPCITFYDNFKIEEVK
ncbi:MAG: family 16 glycoside hydrolase [Candidatus Firestonebacteria bacterium]